MYCTKSDTKSYCATVITSREKHVKFIFVDAENISNRKVEMINAGIMDKVFVFSKNNGAIKKNCEEKHYLYLYKYPTGANQADFYLIANLARVITLMNKEEKQRCEFVLYSQDNSLVTAFEFQCNLHKVKSSIALPPKEQNTVVTLITEEEQKNIDRKILSFLSESLPKLPEEIRNDLKITKKDCAGALRRLSESNEICRVADGDKRWIKINSQ